MEKISAIELQGLIAQCKVLEADLYGPKVLLSADGQTIHKLFRRKRWFSSALIKPYALRFVDNADRLRALGFNTLEAGGISWCRGLGYHLVSYPLLVGSSLREHLQRDERDGVFTQLGEIVAQLHQNGVYFRSLHLGNLLRLESNELALIDVADIRFYRGPLSKSRRLRNFRPLLNRPEDRELIKAQDWRLLGDVYEHHSACSRGLTEAIESLYRHE